VIRITGYGVIAEKPRVGKLRQIFCGPCRKNYTLDRKMDSTFFDGHDELYHHAKFGEDRTTRAGCRCENVVFVTMFFFCLSRSESGAPCVRREHSSNRHCIAVYCPISTRFTAFFARIGLSEALHSSHFGW